MEKYKVVEKFVSIDGESQAAGELACFIRFAGCNLNCGYCDTSWANKPGVPYESMSADEIYNYVRESGVNNVTLTGGEPLLQDNIGSLLRLLSADTNLRIEIETNGSVPVRDYKYIGDNIVFTLDYKLPGSGMSAYMVLDNYKYIDKKDTVKFVVSNEKDLDTARDIIDRYRLTDITTVYISSAFEMIAPADIVQYMIKHGMNGVRLQLQMHKYIWEPDRKGV